MKNIDYINSRLKKKKSSARVLAILVKIRFFKPMIDTISQTSKILNRWIDTITLSNTIGVGPSSNQRKYSLFGAVAIFTLFTGVFRNSILFIEN
jgi:hypothetical protein